MSRLGDLYKAMETLRKEGLSLNEDLERQVSKLEEDIHRRAATATHHHPALITCAVSTLHLRMIWKITA